MPELPEVETVRRALEPCLVGRRFLRVEQRRPDLRFPFPERFVARLEGAEVRTVGRRAKYLLMALSSGESLLAHLGMSGRMTILPPTSEHVTQCPTATYHHAVPADAQSAITTQAGSPPPIGEQIHDHVVFHLDDGARIVFSDHRRFGYMDLVDTATQENCRHLARLGPEPLGNAFSARHLDRALAGKTTPIKAALLDQRVVAGLGNIYVCEALFRSGISPRRLAKSIPGVRAARLVPAIREVLLDAIDAGGSSLRDYAHTDGSLGYFQHTFGVYDREGEPCRKLACPGTVRRIVQSGRSSFYCDRCQR